MDEDSPNCDPADAAVPTVIAEELGGCKKQGEQGNRIEPRQLGAHERNEFSEPRGLPPSIHRVLTSLTGYLVFDVQTACSLCCKLVYSLTPTTRSEQFSQRS